MLCRQASGSLPAELDLVWESGDLITTQWHSCAPMLRVTFRRMVPRELLPSGLLRRVRFFSNSRFAVHLARSLKNGLQPPWWPGKYLKAGLELPKGRRPRIQAGVVCFGNMRAGWRGEVESFSDMSAAQQQGPLLNRKWTRLPPSVFGTEECQPPETNFVCCEGYAVTHTFIFS